LSILYAGSIHDSFNQVTTRADEANLYLSIFDRMTNFPATSTKLTGLQQRLKSTNDGAHRNLHALGRWTALSNIRRGALTFFPYIVLEFLFFYDVHVLDRMEKWKSQSGHHVRGWFEDLGEWEALCALAKLAADQPTWPFPQVVEKSAGPVTIIGQQVGHPLLEPERVPNDVQLGPPGTVLLVTGSNMSGKSTLLRSIGANVALAQMGSVVCADQLILSPVRIETSMRIADSLAEGVSFFMAELKRLKQIVDRGIDFQTDPDRTMLFLLDEILQGTNSRERQIAVSRVVRKLIDRQAIGAISTHDLDLAMTNELAAACQTVHFSEQFSDVDGQKQMTFDYRMKQGIAETTNALKLLDMVGLGE
jgi:DNA mismatch repair ATPase MutS